MKIFKDDRPGPGYDFERNVHTENAIKVFNVLQPHLSTSPETSNPYELFAFLLNAACAYYAQSTNDAATEEFERGMRIAVWAHAMRCDASDSQAKEITEFIFMKSTAIGLLRTRGENPLSVLDEEPTQDVLSWVEQGIDLAQSAATTVGQRV